MEKGFVKIDWNRIEEYSEEEISYFLFLEGKTIDVISKIRNKDKSEVQRHIIDGKIKYRFLAESNNSEELFRKIAKAGKQDKIDFLNSMTKDTKDELVTYIKNNYVDMSGKEKETAVWILGEMKYTDCFDILTKASVHNHVNVRRMAASAMGKIGVIKFETILLRLLDDTNPQVVLYAIKSLDRIGSTVAYNKIKELSTRTDKKYIKEAAEAFCNGKTESERK
ncbi:MAG: HEAT repeat domain-containing protein [Bacillota bacterium]|nr:HEAT repeat domain-containing protein [Bacillota bacterium]